MKPFSSEIVTWITKHAWCSKDTVRRFKEIDISFVTVEIERAWAVCVNKTSQHYDLNDDYDDDE